MPEGLTALKEQMAVGTDVPVLSVKDWATNGELITPEMREHGEGIMGRKRKEGLINGIAYALETIHKPLETIDPLEHAGLKSMNAIRNFFRGSFDPLVISATDCYFRYGWFGIPRLSLDSQREYLDALGEENTVDAAEKALAKVLVMFVRDRRRQEERYMADDEKSVLEIYRPLAGVYDFDQLLRVLVGTHRGASKESSKYDLEYGVIVERLLAAKKQVEKKGVKFSDKKLLAILKLLNIPVDLGIFSAAYRKLKKLLARGDLTEKEYNDGNIRMYWHMRHEGA